jgi:hypothetical protein
MWPALKLTSQDTVFTGDIQCSHGSDHEDYCLPAILRHVVRQILTEVSEVHTAPTIREISEGFWLQRLTVIISGIS